MTKKKSVKNIRLSPSSINAFYYCPRKWYKTYVEGIRGPDTIHTIRGKAVHKACEDIFDKEFMETIPYKVQEAVPILKEKIINIFEEEWNTYEKELEAIELNNDEINNVYTASATALQDFIDRKINAALVLMDKGKAKRFRTAFKKIAPKFKELWIDNRTYNVGGFVDAVEKDSYSDDIALIDYKTSLRHGEMLTADYRRQLALYALMYHDKYKVKPRYVGIHYLLDNSTILLEVTEELEQYAIDTINDVRSKIQEWDVDEEKYPDVCRFKRSDGKWIEYKWKGNM